ncbi:MAG: hypothetical protein ACLQEQ_06010 [Nitrososphaerales archaeon]
MKTALLRRPSLAKIAVLATFVGALAFGGYLGYLAWTNDSFPSQQKPFGDYANVASVEFNGTEYAVTITWQSGSDLPLYVQITSGVSDGANSPVCDLGLASVTPGQSIFMPFGFNGPSAAPTSVELLIAVKPATGAEFTIQQQIDNFTAQVGDIMPPQFACTEPSSPM